MKKHERKLSRIEQELKSKSMNERLSRDFRTSLAERRLFEAAERVKKEGIE